VQGAIKRLGVRAGRGVPRAIASYSIEGRKAVQIVADAYGQALYRSRPSKTSDDGKTQMPAITEDDVATVAQTSRLLQHTPVKARSAREVGKTFGLGVLHYLGSLIEIEAVAFPAALPGKGSVRFNDTAGSMAKDSVFNAASVLRAIAGIDAGNFDLHINIVGGGNIDGPSAGLAIFLALYSAITKAPLPQDVAVTGELSIQGKVRGVGGIVEKLYAARQAGMRSVLIPRENIREVDKSMTGIDVVPVTDVEHVLRELNIRRKSTRHVPVTRRKGARRS
jgi:ATP-dependent Lon protease